MRQRHHHPLRGTGVPAVHVPYRYRKPLQLLLPIPLGVILLQNDFRYLVGQTLVEILFALASNTVRLNLTLLDLAPELKEQGSDSNGYRKPSLVQ